MMRSFGPNRWAAKLRLVVLVGLALLVAGVASPARAQIVNGIGGERPTANGAPPKELEDIGIEDRNGATVPRDVRLTGSDGRSFAVGEYMDDERPLVLVFAYYQCPMLCSLVLNGAVQGLKTVKETPGKEIRVLVVSFDPRDKTDVASKKRAAYLESYERAIEPIDGSELAAFEFATGDESEVRRLAESVGFIYRWDEGLQQFAHAAGIFVVTPKGILSQALTGVDFPAEDLTTAIHEAQKGVWHSPLKSALFYCFKFNPHTGKYNLVAGRALRVAAGLTLMVLLFWMVRLFRSERRRARLGPPAPSDSSEGRTDLDIASGQPAQQHPARTGQE